uniref:hypothetical protein n=1 Tax=Aliarcobacter butzleri TaxID=28197 RepID=UPI001D01C95C
LINEVVETIICQFVLDYHFSIEKFGFIEKKEIANNYRKILLEGKKLLLELQGTLKHLKNGQITSNTILEIMN